MRARWLLALAGIVAGLSVLSGVLGWLFAALALGLESGQLGLAVGVASGAGAALGAIFGQPLFSAGLDRLLGPKEPPLPGHEELARWREALRADVLRRRVRGARSQREQMLRGGPLIEPVVEGEGAEPWDRLIERWPGSGERLVVFGEPGYGKTIASLDAVDRVNRGGELVAELFPLAEWASWAPGREDPSIEAWVIDRLLHSYRDLTPEAAAGLVSQGELVAVFDGFDEVPERFRSRCRDALAAYAGRTPPFRPFLLTSRREEYLALEPRGVEADRHLTLAGLDRERILVALEAGVGGAPRWKGVIAAVRAGDVDLVGLLESPLRLAAAIEAFEGGDPGDLLRLARREDGAEELWNLLLGVKGRGFREASRGDVRRWLAFIAASLISHERQRLWLHELYLYCSPTDRRRFMQVRWALLGGLLAAPWVLAGSAMGWIGAAVLAAMALIGYRRKRDRPVDHIVRRPVRPAFYLKTVPRAALLGAAIGVGCALVCGIALLAILALADIAGDPVDLGASFGDVIEVAAISGGFCSLLGIGVILAMAGGSNVAEEPPEHLAGRGPGAVIAATRDFALFAAALCALLIVLPVPLLVADPLRWWPVPLIGAGFVAWVSGLEAWAFHHWARWRLARAGQLPYRLRGFLEWAHREAGFLRGNEAYEFRHRELRDYLAPQGNPVGAENVCWEDAPHVRRDHQTMARVQVQRGERHMSDGRWERAHEFFEAATKLDPDNLDARQGLAEAEASLRHILVP